MSKSRRRRGAYDPNASSFFDNEGNQGTGHRKARLQHIFQEEIDWLFREEISNPLLEDLRITSVELSPDYRLARISFQLGPEDSSEDLSRIERALAKAVPFLRSRLAEALDMKFVPALRFRLERTFHATYTP